MKTRFRILSIVLCLVLFASMLPITAEADDNSKTGKVSRYSVLILDISGSMWGTPLSKQKEAAVKFCESVLAADGDNYVALVMLDSSSYLGMGFTNELGKLTEYIANLTDNGTTDTNGSLVIAGELLSGVTDNDAIKNIVLCSDGLPCDGAYEYVGPYTSSDYYDYEYANSAYNTATRLQAHYNIYSLGFFHSLSGSDLDFGRRFLKDLQNAGYYEVVDPNDLEFEFGKIAEDVTNTDNTPIIIIPGIMGSRFFSSSTVFNDSTRIWDPVIDGISTSTVGNLWNVRSLTGTVYVRPCEDQHKYADGGNSNNYGREYGALDTYEKIVNRLCDEFPDRPIFFFSYDWRESNAVSASKLNDFILTLGVDKVDLVCHSMGGLVASSYYANHGEEGRVGKIITCGTPYEGAPKLINSVMNWDIVGVGSSITDDSTWKDLALALLGGMISSVKASFQGVAELTPTYNYCQEIPMWKDSWVPFNLGDYELSFEEYAHICADIFGEDNYVDAMRFQQSLHSNNEFVGYNVLLDYDESYFIIGYNQPTITAVKFQFSNNDIDQLLYETDLHYSTKGDGTVPYYSSSISKKVEQLKKDVRWFTYKTDHEGTISSKDSRDRIVSILRNDGNGPESSNLDSQKYTVIRIACPVDATIERNGELLSSKLDNLAIKSSFGRLDFLGSNDEIKIFCVYTEDDEVMNLYGTDEGEMDLSIRYYNEEDNLVDEFVFEDVPITKDTVITTNVGSANEPVLSIDLNGDGIIDNRIVSDNSIRVVLDANGGDVVTNVLQTDENGHLPPNIPAPRREGYHFLGWYTSAIEGERITAVTVFTKSTTIYAHWALITTLPNTAIPNNEPNQNMSLYSISIGSSQNGNIRASQTWAPVGTRITLTALPEDGYFLSNLTVKTSEGTVVGTKEVNNEYAFILPDSNVTVIAEFTAVTEPEKVNPFVDVTRDDPYYGAVLWAYYHEPQITIGQDSTHFAPSAVVTRGEAVTFLWRAMGAPEPETMNIPFEDLVQDYYLKPVVWAFEKGITRGIEDNRFDPNGTLTTAQIITMLFRAMNEGEDGWSTDETGVAVRWARNNGYLDGIQLPVDNLTDCPRAQVVMILKNVLEEG